MWRFFYLLLLLPSLIGAGCTQNDSYTQPTTYAQDPGSLALAKYDTNQDGKIDQGELTASPGLASAWTIWDKNHNQSLEADEINARIETFKNAPEQFMNLTLYVKRQGEPLPDASITLIPEEFLGPDVEGAMARTDKHGFAFPAPKGAKYPGVRSGVYRIQVSLKNPAGEETLPAKYNASTTLGLEIGPDTARGHVELTLSE